MKNLKLQKKVRSVMWDLRVLYLEDDELTREAFSHKLSKICEHIDTAENGEEGYKLYKKFYYDLIITDLEMPKKDGFWFIDKAREESLHKPIIVTTAFDDLEHVHKCIEKGVSSFLVKPIQSDNLHKVLLKFGTVLHEKKVMFQYQKELEHYMNAYTIRNRQFEILQKSLAKILTVDMKKTILEDFQKSSIIAPKFVREGIPKTEKKIDNTDSFDSNAFEQFKTDDLQKFYESDEDIRDYLSTMFLHPEKSNEVFHQIAPIIVDISERISKYPEYSLLGEKLKHLSLILTEITQNQDHKRFNYLFESFMDSFSEWSKYVLGNVHNNSEKNIDIYQVMHDADILCNALVTKEEQDLGELELF